jgi:hypothetical protein
LIIGESGLVSTGHVKRFTVWRENHGMRARVRLLLPGTF